MRLRRWPVLTVAFGALLALVLLLAGSAVRRARQLERSVQILTEDARRNSEYLNAIRAQIYLSGVILRDYLLETSDTHRLAYESKITRNKESMVLHIRQLEAVLGRHGDRTLQSLHTALRAYWESVEPIFAWTPVQRQRMGLTFLHENVIPQREAVIALAEEIADLNTASLEKQQRELEASFGEFYSSLTNLIIFIVPLGVAVAIVATVRVARLEQRSSSQHERTERAEREMRLLSQRLVKAQEEERRSLSRELHDQVGQVLTGLRVGLANLERSYGTKAVFDATIQECRGALEQTIEGVRELAMGLRPSMLDDAGLGAALQWQAREFSKRYDTPVTVTIDAAVDELSDVQRASIYRVVQEALTNCARHAKARAIRIDLQQENQMFTLTVEDDGVGLGNNGLGSGLGLIGIQERVRTLGGTFSLESEPGKGTRMIARFPGAAAVHG